MAARPILTLEHPVLRQRARKVRTVTPALRSLIDDMIETMRAAPGVGLAAPQVGISQRVIVVEYADDREEGAAAPKLYAVVNPEIIRRSTEMVDGSEGCLSIPGYFGEVARHEAVTIRGLDRDGRPFRLKAKDWLARVFQHEIDHLDGVLFIDRATRVWQPEPEEEAVAVQAVGPRREAPLEGTPEGVALRREPPLESTPEGVTPPSKTPEVSA